MKIEIEKIVEQEHEEQWTVINEYGENIGWWPTYEQAERNCHGVCRVEKVEG
jgi:hypothetical protein